MADYRYGVGASIALATLKNVENDVNPRNRSLYGLKTYPLVISSPPIDPFPIRDDLLDAGERGGGVIFHYWTMTLYTYGLQYWINTVFTNGTVVEAAVTIYDRDIYGAYARYNATAILPSLSKGDIVPARNGAFPGSRGLFTVRQRLNDLRAL